MEVLESIIFIVVTFLLSLIFFHVILKYTSKEFWIKIDYFWIGLLFLSLLGAAFQIANFRSKEIEYPIRAQGQIGTLRGLIITMGDSSSRFEYFEMLEQNSNGSTDLALDYQKEGEKYLVLSRSIHELIESISKERDFDFDKWENIYESIKSGRFENDKLAGTHVRDVKEYAQYANDEIQMLREFKNDIQTSSTWELMINVIYPYLFAIALGIRLSKVTFTLKEHQRHNIDT